MLFTALKELLIQNVAQEVVLEFEAVMQAGICDTFPHKKFHWTQAVYRHVQSVGLQQANHNHLGTRKFVHKLMTLALIPEAHLADVSTTFLYCRWRKDCQPLPPMFTLPGLKVLSGLPQHGVYSCSIYALTIMLKDGIIE